MAVGYIVAVLKVKGNWEQGKKKFTARNVQFMKLWSTATVLLTATATATVTKNRYYYDF